MSKIIRDSLRAGLILCVPAIIAWATGRPFIFPSLGPSAFSLVLGSQGENTRRKVIGGHLLGVVGGLVAYHAFAHGLTLAALPAAYSLPLLRLAASGVLSVVLTTFGMLVARVEHPPACATTLIVSLGLLATFLDTVFIMLAIVVMYAVHRGLSPTRG